MIVCYAQGGGLGHLTRIRAYLHTVHADEPATVLSGSPFTADPRVLGPHRLLQAPGSPAEVLAELRPEVLVVDAFPAGINGELDAGCVPPGTRTVHLARLLRWDAYRQVLPPSPILFDQTWTVEEPTAAHSAHLSRVSTAVQPLDLADPAAEARPDAAGSWLILHSGPAAEIHELISYAGECAAAEGRRPRLVLAAPHRPVGLPDGVAHIDPFPAWPLFERAERVITAAGFNAVRQMRPWRAKHRMLPFPRRWDDQFTRAARARAVSPQP
ncbi:hypothetical protein [Actinoplanes awajinensis]|uniref:Glycosyl transferase n=1 Tax=Actinoplanes awajinensis subsp. mycoplanecinus TaxID=135947 RepID=A0A101JIF8_9ACTN|nr:hypothetical protein [Actinoplanes awajinensis]KUL27006.1 hypothetical protein ADL15_36430 [Actinoplanes awajinensis subsp. mycoplanecinus]